MSRKSFHICVDFDVHAVTCPGVWLCPKGSVILRITMFGLSVNTKALTPSFPLLYHEKFRFHKMLRTVNSLTTLQQALKSRNLQMQLVHIAAVPGCTPTTVLATFKSPLSDVFYPSPSERGLNAGVDVDLLLRPTTCFPGILSPKVEISTRVVIEEVVNYSHPDNDTWIVNPVTIPSKKTDCSIDNFDDGKKVRQRPVCHGQTNTQDQCYCCMCYKKNNSVKKPPPFITGKIKRNGRPTYAFLKPNFRPGRLQKKRLKTRYPANEISASSDEYYENSTAKHDEDGHSPSVCKCALCQKYKDYFPNTPCIGCSTPEDSPKMKLKFIKNASGHIKPRKKQQSCHIFEAEESCASKTKQKQKEELKLAVTGSKLLSTSVADSKSCKGCSCGMTNKAVPPAVKEPIPYEAQKKAVINNPPYRRPMSLQTCKSQTTSIVTQMPTTSKMPSAAEKLKDTCRCGIYSCLEWQSSKGRDLRASDASKSNNPTTPTWTKQNKSHRQIFYSNLEDYYRKLYYRARERNTIEGVQACA